MSITFRASPERAEIARLDIGLLNVADRACLRLLYRCEIATGLQLTTLIYPSRRTALRHLRRLWQLGLVERTPLPPDRGGVPVAYRLTRRGLQRLGYAHRRQGGITHVRHALDTVEVVCAIVRSDPDALQAWMTPLMADDLLDRLAKPDGVFILQADRGSGVVCLETDEATEHSPQIRSKLDAYARALPLRRGWHTLFAVPDADRLDWLRRVARWDDRPALTSRAWGTTLPGLSRAGLGASVTPIGWTAPARAIGSILTDPRPRVSRAAVGSPAWVRMLGSGGAEDLDEALEW